MKYRFDEIAINSTEKKKPVEEDKFHYLGLEHLDSKRLKVSRYGSEVAPKGEKLVMRKGDVLFGKRRAYQKKVAIAPFDGIFSAHGMVLRPQENVIIKELFPFFISSDYFLDKAIKISVGSLSPTINWGDLKKQEFLIPEKDIQNKLAELLWAIETNVREYWNLIEATENLIKARFIEMFGHHVVKEKGWELKPIKDVIKKPFAGEWGDEDSDGSGVKVIRTANFTDKGHMDLTDIVSRQIKVEKIEKKRLEYGDIIIEKSGGSGTKPVGRVVFWDQDMLALTNNFTAVIRPKDQGTINNVYLFRFLFDRYWIGDTRKYENKTTGIHNLMLDEYLSFTEIPLPPIELQNEFEQFVKQAEKSKLEVYESLEKLERSKTAILKKYFG